MLTAVKTDKNARHISICEECGKERFVRAGRQNVLCADCNRTKIGKSNKTHGMYADRIYRIHRSMIARCGQTKINHKFAYLYAERGIKVCEEWLNFNNFVSWATANGYGEKLEIDRIDNNLGYSPENCRWVTHAENMKNRRPRAEWKKTSKNRLNNSFSSDETVQRC